MCFNCHKEGHTRVECTQPGGGRRLCFISGDGDHLARDCPRRTTEVPRERAVHSIDEDEQPEDNYFKYVMYDLNVDGVKMCLRLYTLLDSGRPVSFIKLKYVPSEIISVEEGLKDKFRGINSSSLVVLGVITVSANVNKRLAESTRLLVVPDDTMQTSVVLGRDALNLLGFNLTQRSLETNDASFILNIGVSSETDNATDSLYVNHEIPLVTQNQFRRLFSTEYLHRERLTESKVEAKVAIVLREHKPFHFSPRRLSYAEKVRSRKSLING